MTKLYVVRIARQKSIEEMAAVIGETPQIYEKIEMGIYDAPDSTYEKLAKHHCVPVDYLKGLECVTPVPYEEWEEDQKVDYNNAANEYEREYLYQKYGNMAKKQ